MTERASIAPPPQRVIPATRGRPGTRVGKALRRRQIISRVLAGASNQDIADELGISAHTVGAHIAKVLETWESQERGDVDRVRALQLARIDRVVQAHFPEAIGQEIDQEATEERGATVYFPASRASAELILRAEALRARIAGTEAAKKIEHSGSLGFHLDAEEVEREARVWASSGGDVIDAGPVRELDA